ncbi:Response regulator of zinc sigma-54-dependent two-component system [hydrothermal vent metagenome]|uniref:Response regulator of zinc sigma-54-dependent two-component system n=1 Tax=hydrothermal vent metagenome TaxID=652676 RepID=A0A3B1BUJ9_9ZZZZ
MRIALTEALIRSGHTVRTASNGDEGLLLLSKMAVDLVISDVKMPKMTGLDLLQKVRENNNNTHFVLITAYGSIDDAVSAMKDGATDYLLKPFSADTLDALIRRIFDNGDTNAIPPEIKRPQPAAKIVRKNVRSRAIITENEKMKKALDIADRVAASRSTVLIHGESGVGKELVARYIHENSDRRDQAFVTVNCAAVPETLLESELFGHEKGAFTGAIARKIGKFELANHGAILLDEVTEMKKSLQAKLLRVLQESEIDRVGGEGPIPLDIRVIATTNRDIGNAVEEGSFREDLFFRLNVIPLHIPPLRERKDDIAILVSYFIQKFNALMGKSVTGVEPATMDILKERSWRGNVRELENMMERAVLLTTGDDITQKDLMLDADIGLQVKSGDDKNMRAEEVTRPGLTVGEMEKKLIERTLETVQGNRTRAARMLGVSIRTLRNKLNDYKAGKGPSNLSGEDND